MKQLKEIREKDTGDLTTDLETLRKESFHLSFRASGEQTNNPARTRQIRRHIARIKTVLRERELAAALAAAEAKAASTGTTES